MPITLSQTPYPLFVPVQISAVDQAYLSQREQYEQERQAQAFKLRRQLIRQRALFQRRLSRSLSAPLRTELNIQVVLDTQYLQRPGFIGVFEDTGIQWTLSFQSRWLGGRWYFRSTHSSRLYACSPHQLETQLCYALGQERTYSCFARA